MNPGSTSVRASRMIAGAALAALLVIALCGWAGLFTSTPVSSSDNESSSAIDNSVTSFLGSYRDRDWAAASRQSCGDLYIQLLSNDHQGIISSPTTLRAAIIDATDFHYTTIDGPVATTYARVLIGVPGDLEGNTPAIAYFAPAKTDSTWKVCTATNAAAGALDPQ